MQWKFNPLVRPPNGGVYIFSSCSRLAEGLPKLETQQTSYYVLYLCVTPQEVYFKLSTDVLIGSASQAILIGAAS